MPSSVHHDPGVLVGRDRELARLTGLFDGLGDHGRAVVLRGTTGIGKSALLDHLVRHAEQAGARVLRVAGTESESHLQFAGLHQLLRPLRCDIALLPEIHRTRLNAAFGLSDAVVPDAFVVALAALEALSEAGTRGRLLVVAEDAHWLDQSTADVLAFLARRIESEPILLAAAVRLGERSSFDGAGLPELLVPPLAPEDAATLLDTHAAGLSAGLRRQLLDDAAGTPLCLIELSVTARTVTPAVTGLPPRRALSERLTATFTARVQNLPEATMTALLVAALDDGALVAEIGAAVERLTGREPAPADWAPAVAARLVEPPDIRVRFRHPLMRSAMYQHVTAERRREVHTALADVLVDDPERSIWHRAAATEGPDEALAVTLEDRARSALRRGAVAGAVAALETAARLSAEPDQQADRLLGAAAAAVELGRPDIVDRLLAEAGRLDLSFERRTRLAWTREGFEDGLRAGGTDALTLARLAEAIAAGDDVDGAVRILWSAALRCFWTEPGDAARAKIVAVAEGLPLDESDARVLAILAYAAPIDRGAVVIEHSRRLAAHSEALDPQTERLLGSGGVLLGTLELAKNRSARSLPGLRADGRLQLLARALAAQAWSATHLVDLSVAIPAAEEARALAAETGQPYVRALAQAVQAKIAALRGDLDEAERLAAEAVRTALPVIARPVLATAQEARALAAAAAGEFDEAFTRYARMHDPADPSYQLALRCHTVTGLVDAAVRAGRQQAASSIVAGLEQAATRTTAPSLHAGLRHARALLADERHAEALFAEALRGRPDQQLFARAQTEMAYGEWLRRQRRVTESRDPLRAARDTFDALGAAPWGDRARRELRAAGEQSTGRSQSAMDRLTPQELQIAQLAATGLTNREIGAQLYISHRTVDAHLARAFRKLGIRTRTQLHVALGQQPI